MTERQHGSLADELLAEFAFIQVGLRQDQRERQVFLGFALAASGTILGLLARPASVPSANQALVLILVAIAVTIVAEVLTVRATIGVASAGVYLRLFIEPEMDGLNFQTRNRLFLEHMDSRVSASWALAIAYLVLTAGLGVAWFTIDLTTHREWLQSGLVLLALVVSVGFAITLWWTSRFGWTRVEHAWQAVKAEQASSA